MQAVVGALRAVLGLDSIAFEKGAQDAQKTLKGLNKSFDQMGAGVTSMARSMNTALSSIGVGVSLGGLVLLQKSLQDWAAQLKDQADRLGISTTALQAYEFAAVKAGVSQEEMNKSLEFFNRKLGDAKAGVPGAVDDFKKLGVKLLDSKGQLIPFGDALQLVAIKIGAMGTAQEKAAASQNFFSKSGKDTLLMLEALQRSLGELNQQAAAGGGLVSQKTLDHLDEMKKKLALLTLQWRTTVAEFAAKVEIGAIEAVTRFVEALKLQNALQAERDKAAEVKRAQDAAAARQAEIDKFKLENEEKIGRVQALLDDTRMRSEKAIHTQRMQLLREVYELEGIIAALRGGEGSKTGKGTPPGGSSPFTGEPDPSHKAPPAGGVADPTKVGGGGQSPEERARATLKLWTEEMQVYQQTLVELSHNFTVPLDEVERKLESQRRLTKDIAAAAKGISDPKLVEQITAEAKAREGLRLQYEEIKKAAKDAETAEKAFGDGSVELAARQRELTAAYGTGRLSLEAMNIAMQEATRNAELQRLKMIGLTDQGWGGFIAGFKTAQIEWDRANSAFAAGQKAFESVMSHMEDALAQFVTTGKLKFRDLANSIISDLIRMQLKAATTSLFGGAGGLGGLLGSIFGGGGNISGFAGATGGSGNIEGFAAGGMPPIGQPSWVGEHGPELFVPRAAGSIIPNDALGGGGGGVVFNISVTGGDEAGVYRALNRVMPQMKTQLADYILDRRMRGGKFQQGFRG